MNSKLLTIAVVGCLGLLLIVVLALRWRSRRVNVEQFTRKWKELQGYCRDKETWPQALQEADKLLDTALKKRRFKGKSMGERMVAAQRVITNNDAMWFAHNLVRRMGERPDAKLKEQDVKAALIGFRNALKDLNALMTPQKTQAETEEAEAS